VVRTLARAEEIFRQKALEAEENAALIMETARTEARALVAEAETEAQNRAETIMDKARADSEALAAHSASDRAEAEEYLARAKVSESEAEEKLAAVSGRIANLDTEKAAMDADFAARNAAQAEEYAQTRADIESTRQSIWDETLAKATEQGTASGLAQGLAEGKDRGFKEASEAFNEKVAGFLPIMEKMEKLYNDLWKANGPMMVNLAIEAAEQILNKELREAKDLTVRAFEACIDYLSQANRVLFIARSQDIAALEEARAEYRQRLGALLTVSFKADDSLGPGDLIMESDVGRLDATVKYRSAQVMEVLRQAFADMSAAPPEVKAAELPEANESSEDTEARTEETDAEISDENPPQEAQ
jgi:flagellar biosynthesis/type III secretory pathway protein FliH